MNNSKTFQIVDILSDDWTKEKQMELILIRKVMKKQGL